MLLRQLHDVRVGLGQRHGREERGDLRQAADGAHDQLLGIGVGELFGKGHRHQFGLAVEIRKGNGGHLVGGVHLPRRGIAEETIAVEACLAVALVSQHLLHIHLVLLGNCVPALCHAVAHVGLRALVDVVELAVVVQREAIWLGPQFGEAVHCSEKLGGTLIRVWVRRLRAQAPFDFAVAGKVRLDDTIHAAITGVALLTLVQKVVAALVHRPLDAGKVARSGISVERVGFTASASGLRRLQQSCGLGHVEHRLLRIHVREGHQAEGRHVGELGEQPQGIRVLPGVQELPRLRHNVHGSVGRAAHTRLDGHVHGRCHFGGDSVLGRKESGHRVVAGEVDFANGIVPRVGHQQAVGRAEGQPLGRAEVGAAAT